MLGLKNMRMMLKKLKKTIHKYEKLLADGAILNREQINSIICNYKNIYYDLINTARKLRCVAVGVIDSNDRVSIISKDNLIS